MKHYVFLKIPDAAILAEAVCFFIKSLNGKKQARYCHFINVNTVL